MRGSDGIPGPELADRFMAQALLAGIKIVEKKVTALQWENGLFRIRTNKRTLFSRTVIVASGTTPKKLPGIKPRGSAKEKLIYEIGPLLNIDGKHVAIAGGGDAAFDYALNLSKKNSVVILNRSDMTKCLPLLKERAANVAAITCFPNASIRAISGTQDGRLMVKGLYSGQPLVFLADYVLGAIGRDPRTDFFADPSIANQLEELQKRGLLCLAGDVKNGAFRQTAIAAGDGVRAGMLISNTLSGLKRGT